MDRRGGRAGFRGGSRGGSRGGFGSRGGSAGGRGRGAPRGRGRGRGRGRTNADVPRSAKFDDSRLASKSDDEMESGSEEESSEDEDDVMDVDSDDEDEEDDIQPGKPYTSLLKSLVESNPHKAKRRKLDHPTEEAEQSKPQPQSDDEDGQEKGAVDVDEVDEPEEDPTNIAPEDLFDEDDDLDATDPFETHFSNPDDKVYPRRVKAAEQAKWKMQRQPFESTRAYWSYPETGEEVPLPGPMSSVADLKLKKRLKDSIESKLSKFDATEKTIAPFLYNYRDLLYCNRTVAQSDNLRRLVALHALNHIFKTRDRVIKNNAKLSKAADGNGQDLELRDQGFTRPKVLVILPTRQSCVKFVDAIISICEPDQQENRKRFDDGYIDKSGKFSDDKPQDFRDLFGGNDDDMFRLGLKFTRKTVKYFSQFYNSDIIFASPLGLRMAIGSEEEKKKVDFDFLSSIEMVIVDQADALLMQNWEHVEFIFEHLNIQPRDAHGCDFSRVRSWYLDDQAKYFRQTVVLSAFNAPELAELMRAHCHNWAGKVRLQPECPGMIQHLPVKAKQTFSRFDSTSVAADPDARFAYFTKAIVPTLTKRNAKDAAGTLIFIPSYLDFVRVRNFFANSPIVESVSFGNISEYADIPEASRARSHFLTGRHKVLLYTERAHHFRRYQIKGVKRVVFYALPDNPVFYQEIAGDYLAKSEQSLLLEPGQGQVRVMFSKYDVMKLERVVGTSRVGRMLKEVGDTFDFV